MHYRPPERSERRIVLGATGGTAVMTELITPPGALVAAGPYSPGLLTGDWIFLSGQGGFDPETGGLVAITSPTRPQQQSGGRNAVEVTVVARRPGSTPSAGAPAGR
jgi:enamine deaminase RidA (YjgF/YER057c/UK114 family)